MQTQILHQQPEKLGQPEGNHNLLWCTDWIDCIWGWGSEWSPDGYNIKEIRCIVYGIYARRSNGSCLCVHMTQAQEQVLSGAKGSQPPKQIFGKSWEFGPRSFTLTAKAKAAVKKKKDQSAQNPNSIISQGITWNFSMAWTKYITCGESLSDQAVIICHHKHYQ